MLKSILVIIGGLFIGFLVGYLIILYTPFFPSQLKNKPLTKLLLPKKQVIGFLPYWLLGKADKDYSQYITTLTYFGLTIDTDGKILKNLNGEEKELGWDNLASGKLDPFLDEAKKKDVELSLLIFNGDEASISALLKKPVPHAQNLVNEVAPIMQKYGFTAINLDIESVKEASEEARINFKEFVKTVKTEMDNKKLGTLSIDISPTAYIKKYLINPQAVTQYVDTVIIMAYDYHYPDSQVTGAVAPLSGYGEIAEFDTEEGIRQVLSITPADKVILGIPLYGYEWEALGDKPRSAVIPASGLTASNARVEKLLKDCDNCQVHFDTTDQESYIIYKDEVFNTFHHIFYPDKKSTTAKVDFAKKNKLGGIAMWALGYEGDSILEPLKGYK